MRLLDKQKIYFPPHRDYAKDTFHTFVIQVENRNELKNYLMKHGINTSIHYPTPIHLQDASKYLGYKKGDFPVTEKQSKKILTLPVNNTLTSNQINYICEKINKFYK